MKLHDLNASVFVTRIACVAVILFVAATGLTLSGEAQTVNSGERVFGKVTIEPFLDDSNGNEVYMLETQKTPSPSRSNIRAAAPLYAVVYPVSSTVPEYELNCQVTNCDHLNVLPFPDTDYGLLPGSDQACTDFNAGNPCSPVKGHDHLVGVASTGGDFNVAWHVELVLFTQHAFIDSQINTRITTLSQLQALVNSGDAFIVDTPITFNCSVVSEQTYDLGSPVVIPYP
jgi:hypothetical protein